MELSSEYQMWAKGPSKALKCLRYLLRNPDATSSTAAAACGASYNIAWGAKSDIDKYGAQAMIPLAKFDVPDPVVVRSKDYKPKVKASSFAVLDAITTPDLDDEALINKLRELGFERVTPSTEVTTTPPLVEKLEKGVQVSDGSTASYYELPDGARELQDLISHKNMNSQIGEIFRACYRMGEASHSDELRDAKKIRFYIDAEIERLLRK
tara:strand:- start:6280 stop:6909 length:630 start_codon:yes stop_codon:yes gene_type:complete